MKKIEIWLEEKILHLLGQHNDRLSRERLVRILASSSHNQHWELLLVEQPGWRHVAYQKRKSRVCRIVSRLARQHQLRVGDENGERSAVCDEYIFKNSLLDRIARHLEDADGPQV